VIGMSLAVHLALVSCAASAPSAGGSDGAGEPRSAAARAQVGVAAETPTGDAGSPATTVANSDAGAATIGAACEPADRVDVAAPFRPMFEKGRSFRYFVTDVVDPHGPDGKKIISKQNVDCTIASLCRFSTGIAASELTCTGDSGATPAETLAFLSDKDALWLASALPADEPAARRAIAETPLATKAQSSSKRTFEQPGMHAGTVDKCTEVVKASAFQTCRDVHCNVKVGYGPTQDDACVTPNRGLTSWSRVNLAGPRSTHWVLLDTQAP
jgi:hypothetical protein